MRPAGCCLLPKVARRLFPSPTDRSGPEERRTKWDIQNMIRVAKLDVHGMQVDWSALNGFKTPTGLGHQVLAEQQGTITRPGDV
jgi:hypothetical protein